MKPLEERLDDGGPAFPWTTCGSEGYSGQNGHNDGMSLRDYFAGQALCGYVSRASQISVKAGAKFAYMLADAMLEARKRKPLSVDEVER